MSLKSPVMRISALKLTYLSCYLKNVYFCNDFSGDLKVSESHLVSFFFGRFGSRTGVPSGGSKREPNLFKMCGGDTSSEGAAPTTGWPPPTDYHLRPPRHPAPPQQQPPQLRRPSTRQCRMFSTAIGSQCHRGKFPGTLPYRDDISPTWKKYSFFFRF